MTAADGRVLIVNADDFGLSAGVNAGVIRAHERGIVTSASLMVRWPGLADAAAYARENTRLGVGLHADLGEWNWSDDGWVPAYEVVPVRDPDAVEAELRGQLEIFRELVGRDPTHIDSHQHLHVKFGDEPLRRFVKTARELGVPLRHMSAPLRYRGDLYGQTERGHARPDAISVERLVEIIRSIPPGVTELGCHPAAGEDFESPYKAERATEMEVLCDPRVREAIEREQIELRSFADVTLGDC